MEESVTSVEPTATDTDRRSYGVLVSQSSAIPAVPPMGKPCTPEPARQELPSAFEENILTRHIRKVPTESEAKHVLKRRGMPKMADLREASLEDKIAALAYLPYAYNPSGAALRFAQKVVAHVRSSLLLRDPADPRYSRFFYGQADVMRGGKLKAMPSFLDSLQGTGFLLAGPSGSGKTALIQRLRVLIGERHTLLHVPEPLPAKMVFLPMLIVQWPDCATVDGLLANLKTALIAELGSAATTDDTFANFRGKNGRNAAIAVCIFLNLGLLVLDGGCLRSLRGEFREIFDFIATLQEYSGIPTLLSCTYPMLQVLARNGGKGANLGNAHTEYWDLIPPGKLWTSYCLWFWKLGPVPSNIAMPEQLPSQLWKVSLGNMRVLAQGFSAIHEALIRNEELLARGTLSPQDIAALLAVRLRIFEEPMKVLQSFQLNKEVPADDLWIHGDYLPFEAFNNTPSGDFERRAKHGRLARR